MQTHHFNGGLTITAFWEAKPGHADTIADILGRFAPRAREEPGVKLFLVHRAVANPGQFLFYELFEDKAAFAAHQETPHFHSLILGKALPLLSRRERTEYSLL
ncbi:MAG: putative quinol monooxygenase [Acetobacteraceae bacterium]